MAKQSSKKHRPAPKPAPRATTPKERGASAFRQGKFSLAIQEWQALEPAAHAEVAAAIAEAYFRRALTPYHPLADAIEDLQRAVELQPAEPRFSYHLGLAYHRAGELGKARASYARAAELGFSRTGLGYVRGLAELEHDPNVDLSSLDWLASTDRAALAPVQALLSGHPERVGHGDGGPLMPLWQGLGYLARGETEAAHTVLTLPPGQRAPKGADEIRTFYLGIAAASTGDLEAAQRHWTDSARAADRFGASRPARLTEALGWTQGQQLHLYTDAGQWQPVFAATYGKTGIPKDPGQLRLALVAAHRLGAETWKVGEPAEAARYWQAMLRMLKKHPEAGETVPVAHNLAIAQERLEQWENAADHWAAVLASLPRPRGRKKDAEAEAAREARRTWLRQRILENLKRSGHADKAIEYFKQSVKADPDNLDLRLEMVSALLANDQVIAARNEVDRILKKDPDFVPAYLMRATIHTRRYEMKEAETAVREAFRRDPSHAGARGAVALFLQSEAAQAYNNGQYRKAREKYLEALEVKPNDTAILAYLAQTELRLHHLETAREHLETALAVGTVKAYLDVLEIWIIEENQAEADAVVERAVAAGLGADVCIIGGINSVIDFTPPPVPPLLGGGGKQPAALRSPWLGWAEKLVERGIAASENEIEALHHVMSLLAPEQLHVGLPYAQRLVALQPEDIQSQMLLALTTACSGDTDRALKILQGAEKLARRQNDGEQLDRILEMREQLSSPLGALLPLLGGLDSEFLDDPDFLDDLRDIKY